MKTSPDFPIHFLKVYIIPQPARGFSFEDFGPPAPSLITANGDAAFTESVLRLTPDEGSRVGSAFFNAPFAFDAHTSFASHFQFRIHGERAGTPEGADGLVFIMQNDPRGVRALGTDGSGLGYSFGGAFGESPMINSIGVAFRTFPFQLSNQGNVELLQIDPNALTSLLAESLQSFNFANSNPLNVWIDYDGQTDVLQIYLSQTPRKPRAPVLTQTVAIEAVVGAQAFFGFSAATGARFNIHDIERWELRITPTAPVNDLVAFEPLPETYRFLPGPTGCPAGFVGIFRFEARLTNSSDRSLAFLAAQVVTLTNGNLLLNADGGPGGVGAQVTVPRLEGFIDGVLTAAEFVDMPFAICVREQSPFRFFVDVLGVVGNPATQTQVLLSYLSPGYRFLVVPSGEGAGFDQPAFDDSHFAVGEAAFGTGGFCPLDATMQTPWPLETDLLLRKTFQVPANTTMVHVAVAIDNDVQVFINGVDISGGGCSRTRAVPNGTGFSLPCQRACWSSTGTTSWRCAPAIVG
jgi:hypothetical protein